jgi:hypothetical protein
MVTEASFYVGHLEVASDASLWRKDMIQVVLAQFIPQPTAYWNSKTPLEALEYFRRDHARKGFLEQPLPAPAANPLLVKETVGEIDYLVVQKRDTDFETVCHAPLVRLLKVGPRKPELLVYNTKVADGTSVQFVRIAILNARVNTDSSLPFRFQDGFDPNLTLEVGGVTSGSIFPAHGPENHLEPAGNPTHAIDPRGANRTA